MENSFIQYLHDKLPKIIYKMEKYNILILRPWVFFTMHWKLLDSKIQRRPFFFKQKQVRHSAQRKLTHFLCYSNTSKHAYDMGKISIKLVNKKILPFGKLP